MIKLERKLIRTDGTETLLNEPLTVNQIAALIGADTLDSFAVRNGSQELFAVMVDDLGYRKELPANVTATGLYWSICKPGTAHKILGDVVLVPDSDFGKSC